MYLHHQEMQEILKEYEKGKFMDFHQIILDDDGIPNLINKMREI